MKRTLVGILALALLATGIPAFGGRFEDAVRSNWRGAWVLLEIETWSTCSGTYFNNDVSGKYVTARAGRKFEPGELAKVDKVQVHRKKVDLMVTVATSTLHPRQDGPFTLYDKRGCKIELEVAIPRDVINAKDVEWVERALGEVAQKFETERAARGSDAWNGRGPDEYPDDYEMTLARHAVWKAEETNRTIEARIDASLATAETIAGRVKSNTFYLAGFAAGTKVLREWREHDCGKLIGGNFASVRRKPSEEYEDNTAYSAGFSDGQQLVYSLALVRRLPGCYVDVPPLPEEYADAGATTAQR